VPSEATCARAPQKMTGRGAGEKKSQNKREKWQLSLHSTRRPTGCMQARRLAREVHVFIHIPAGTKFTTEDRKQGPKRKGLMSYIVSLVAPAAQFPPASHPPPPHPVVALTTCEQVTSDGGKYFVRASERERCTLR
jgi:hypothetical protein